MEKPCIEGLATHDDPESCTVGRKAGGEALTGAHTGGPLSREIKTTGVPTLFLEAEGNTGVAVSARRLPTRRGPRPPARAEPSWTRHGRSLERPPRMAGRAAPGRPTV